MKIFKEIFGRIWTVYALILFIPSLLIAALLLWMTGFFEEPNKTEVFRKIIQGWMRGFLFLVGCPIFTKGKHHFKKGENYIVVCNHNSLMDVPISTPEIPGPNKTIAKESMARIPIFSVIYKRGSILIDRNSDQSRRTSFEKMKEVLKSGMHMCIYPEGTRNRTGKPLKSFHDGAFKLAQTTGHAIIPALMFNTAKVMPPNKIFFLWPKPLKIHFLEPVRLNTGESLEEYKTRIFNIMWDYYIKNA